MTLLGGFLTFVESVVRYLELTVKKNILILSILTMILLMCQATVEAQNQLPLALKSVIPDNYKIIYELYHKSDFIVNIDINLEMPSKYGCNDNLKDPSYIEISIYSIGRTDIAKMQEDIMPFSQYYPTKNSFRPQMDIMDELVKYSETNIVDLSGGRGAYYTMTRKCIEAQYDEYQGVFLMSLFGNHSTRIAISVSGSIDDSDAISIVQEMYNIFNKFDFQNI